MVAGELGESPQCAKTVRARGLELKACGALDCRAVGLLDEPAEGLVLGQWQEQPKPSPRMKQLLPPRGLGSVSPTLCPAKLPPTAEVSHSSSPQPLRTVMDNKTNILVNSTNRQRRKPFTFWCYLELPSFLFSF